MLEAETAPSGVGSPAGEWLARCPRNRESEIVVADLDEGSSSVSIALVYARPWRRKAWAGVYESHLVQDARSADLTLI